MSVSSSGQNSLDAVGRERSHGNTYSKQDYSHPPLPQHAALWLRCLSMLLSDFAASACCSLASLPQHAALWLRCLSMLLSGFAVTACRSLTGWIRLPIRLGSDCTGTDGLPSPTALCPSGLHSIRCSCRAPLCEPLCPLCVTTAYVWLPSVSV